MLWNAHAGQLWRRFTTYLPRELAKAAGLTLRELTEQVRVSYAKVAAYQRRGVVHFHAVIRLDHRHGDHDPPPVWATLQLLEDAIRAAAAAVHLEVAVPTLGRDVRLGWGDQVDIQPIVAFGHGEPVTEEAVAGYIGKYATKAAETTGALDRERPTATHPLRRIASVTIGRCRRIPREALDPFVSGLSGKGL